MYEGCAMMDHIKFMFVWSNSVSHPLSWRRWLLRALKKFTIGHKNFQVVLHQQLEISIFNINSRNIFKKLGKTFLFRRRVAWKSLKILTQHRFFQWYMKKCIKISCSCAKYSKIEYFYSYDSSSDLFAQVVSLATTVCLADDGSNYWST